MGGAERRRAVGSAVAMQVVAGMRVERAMSAIPPPPSASWPWRPHPLRLTGTDSLSCGLHAVQGHSYMYGFPTVHLCNGRGCVYGDELL